MADRVSAWRFPPLLGDGAMGTYLLPAPRWFGTAPPSTLCLTAPERVLEAHRAYRAAGAQVLQTNSFGADRISLEGTPWAGRVPEIARTAVALAREAAGDGLVAGTVAALARPAGWAGMHQREAQAAYAEIIDALLEAGVDFLLLETMTDLFSAMLAVSAALAAGAKVSVACTVAVGDRLMLACGCTAAEAAVRLREAGADVIGVNCGDGPATVLAAGRIMRATTPDLPLVLQPSAGLPGGRDAPAWTLSPAGFAAFTEEARRLGTALIGGCCGTTPEHIAAVNAPPDAVL